MADETKKPAAVVETPQVPILAAPTYVPVKSDLSYLAGLKKTTPKHDNVKTSLYWYGMLPADGSVPTWTRDKFGNVIPGPATTSLDSWHRKEGLSEWRGKCPWFQSVSIRGITFPAFSGYSQRSGFEMPNQAVMNDITKAGHVDHFTDEDIAQIKYEADHTFIKPPVSLAAPHTADIYRVIEDPPKSGIWIHENQAAGSTIGRRSFFDPETDKPVSDYVYLIKIQDSFQQRDLESIMRNPLTSLSGR